METEINFNLALMQEDILHYLAPLLDGPTLKEARLVCKIWNLAVEKEIKNRLKLVAFRHSETQPDPEALNNDRTCPEILTNVDFCHSSKELLWVMTQERLQNEVDCSWVLPERVSRPYHHERSTLQFFRDIGSSTAINSVKVFDGCQIHSVVEALNENLIPNLQALEICVTDDNAYEQAYNDGPIQDFDTSILAVPLPSLTWLSIKTNCLKEKDGGFYQKLINAASNLKFLSCAVIFDPSRLPELRKLKLMGRTSNLSSVIQYDQEIIQKRLLPLKDQLHFLSLENVHLEVEFLQFPNVKTLEMKCVHLQPTVPGSLSSYFPSLIRFKLHTLHKNEVFLERGLPETLKIFEFEGKCLENEFQRPPELVFLPNLHLMAPKLKLMVCNLGRRECCEGKLTNLFRMTFPNLTINLKGKMNFVEILELIGKADFEKQTEERGEILEIKNGKIAKDMFLVKVGEVWLDVVEKEVDVETMESGDQVDWFGIASSKLFKKFNLVRFLHFKIEAELMSRLEKVIRQRKLAVEFFA